jgi:hypothetical protein
VKLYRGFSILAMALVSPVAIKGEKKNKVKVGELRPCSL